jgi:hypothetical protein
MDQSVKQTLDQKETRSVKTGKEVTPECCLSPFLFNFYGKCLTKEALEGFGCFKIEDVIPTTKYADDLVLLAKEDQTN